VDIHISRIRASIEPPSDYTYIHGVRGFGYRFEPVPKEAVVSGQTTPEKRTD
jgi:DNA-binding winged helix-turn-helix (wHTH) protein